MNMNIKAINLREVFFVTLLFIITIVLSSKGIFDESVIILNGDMPKYLMNGLFFYDFFSDFPQFNFMDYAYRYFAHYPALSLGHHPILLGIAEAPFYAVFGVSVFSARLTIVFFALLGVMSWYLLVKKTFDSNIALISCLLFITTPFIVEFSRIVMSEIPSLSLLILTIYLLVTYCESDKSFYAYGTAFSLVLTLYAKQTAIFIVPAILFYIFLRKGLKGLYRKEMIISYLLIIVCLMPLVLITLKFSQTNVKWVMTQSTSSRLSGDNLLFYIKALTKKHLTLPLIIVSLVCMIYSIYKREKGVTLFLIWIVSCYLFFTALGIQKNPRYAIYWIPPFCLFAAIALKYASNSWLRYSFYSVFLIILAYQFSLAYNKKLAYADGYEKAAKYVLANRKGPSVLYQGVSDTGYFIFYVRKHDPGRNLIVLRSDKLLATSQMKWIVEERISSKKEIYEILNDFGVDFVVIEDLKSKSRSLEWLREETRSDKFILRETINLNSSDDRVNNKKLLVYEYKGFTLPKKGKVLDMNIPLMGDSIKVPLENL